MYKLKNNIRELLKNDRNLHKKNKENLEKIINNNTLYEKSRVEKLLKGIKDNINKKEELTKGLLKKLDLKLNINKINYGKVISLLKSKCNENGNKSFITNELKNNIKKFNKVDNEKIKKLLERLLKNIPENINHFENTTINFTNNSVKNTKNEDNTILQIKKLLLVNLDKYLESNNINTTPIKNVKDILVNIYKEILRKKDRVFIEEVQKGIINLVKIENFVNLLDFKYKKINQSFLKSLFNVYFKLNKNYKNNNKVGNILYLTNTFSIKDIKADFKDNSKISKTGYLYLEKLKEELRENDKIVNHICKYYHTILTSDYDSSKITANYFLKGIEKCKKKIDDNRFSISLLDEKKSSKENNIFLQIFIQCYPFKNIIISGHKKIFQNLIGRQLDNLNGSEIKYICKALNQKSYKLIINEEKIRKLINKPKVNIDDKLLKFILSDLFTANKNYIELNEGQTLSSNYFNSFIKGKFPISNTNKKNSMIKLIKNIIKSKLSQKKNLKNEDKINESLTKIMNE